MSTFPLGHMKKSLLSFGEDDFFELSPFLGENELATKVEDLAQTAEDSGRVEFAETADNADFNPITPQDLVPSSQPRKNKPTRYGRARRQRSGRSKAARATITNAAAAFQTLWHRCGDPYMTACYFLACKPSAIPNAFLYGYTR
jgi:hypothetical protein